jgi:hypothetical protein
MLIYCVGLDTLLIQSEFIASMASSQAYTRAYIWSFSSWAPMDILEASKFFASCSNRAVIEIVVMVLVAPLNKFKGCPGK